MCIAISTLSSNGLEQWLWAKHCLRCLRYMHEWHRRRSYGVRVNFDHFSLLYIFFFFLCVNVAANKGPSSQGYGFSCGHVWMWELDCEESWALKNWCFWTVVLEKTLESPLDCKEIQPVHPKGDQSWVFIGRTDAKAETPILWPPRAKSWLIGKDSDAGRDWGQEKKGMTEDEMAGWHHRLHGSEFEWTPGVGDGQGGLACCDSWRCKESDMTERLNWIELNQSEECYLKLRVVFNYVSDSGQNVRVIVLNWMYLVGNNSWRYGQQVPKESEHSVSLWLKITQLQNSGVS